MQKIVLVIPSYNNSSWYKQNLDSVISQNYPDYRVIYTDDASTDNTFSLVENYVNEKRVRDKFTLIQNSERTGAMCNLYQMIHSCEDEEIVATLDGDDWLNGDDALSKVSAAYSDGETLMTYGSYVDWPRNTRGCAKLVPQHVINRNLYRKSPWCFSHLRTFKAKIFKELPKSDFQIDNKWMMSAWDLPIMFGIAEKSRGKFKYINDILYCYNNNNPLSDFKVRLSEQQHFERIVRSRTPYM